MASDLEGALARARACISRESSCYLLTDDIRALVERIAALEPMEALLRELREEVKDWQDALCGERDGLDELCAKVDAALEGGHVEG
jgi:hypothetical protein